MEIFAVVFLSMGSLLLGMALCAVYYFKFGGNGYERRF